MLDLSELLLLLGCQMVVSGLFAMITIVALGWWYGQQMLSMKMGGISPAGVQARVQKAERQELALMELAQTIQSGADPKEAIKAVGLKYPDVAMDFIRKGIKAGGLKI